MKWYDMKFDEIVERYYELHRLLRHDEYVLDEAEYEEYTGLCDYLLDRILQENSGVLERLKHR